MTTDFTILVLLYGDHTNLADRCLRSIAETVRAGDLTNLRVGMNAVCKQTSDWVRAWVPEENIWEFSENRHKYPVMREMIHGRRRIETPYTMWFDDDSYLTGFKLSETDPGNYWLSRVEAAMINSDMIGAIYGIDWHKNQRLWVQDQPWYNGKSTADRQKIRFATGGWWTMRTDILYGWNYPWPELDHRGGDVMMGELCYQRGLRLNQFREGLKINANIKGVENKSPRRGFDQNPIGYDYRPDAKPAVSTPIPPQPQLPRKRPLILEL